MSVKISEDWVMVEERKKGNERDGGGSEREKERYKERVCRGEGRECILGFRQNSSLIQKPWVYCE